MTSQLLTCTTLPIQDKRGEIKCQRTRPLHLGLIHPKPLSVQAKQADTEIRPISMMGLLIGFLIMTLVGVVGDYGVLATQGLTTKISAYAMKCRKCEFRSKNY